MGTSQTTASTHDDRLAHLTPQARGRLLTREGRALWVAHRSVQKAATELVSRYSRVSSLQAHRYAAGLSQQGAAERYNQAAGYQTAIGSTTINAWEQWASGKGQGSPPNLSNVLMLCAVYGAGPTGLAEERISPAGLVAAAYERLAIEDQLALKQFTEATSRPPTDRASTLEPTQVGTHFPLSAPTVDFGNPILNVFTLPSPQPGRLLDLTWDTFGYGIESLSQQIKSLGKRLDVDLCFGVNEAGLVMATFLASHRLSRCPIGYLRCNKIRGGIELAEESFYPHAKDAPTIVICDFEVKAADVIGFLVHALRTRYPHAELYFAVFGAMTNKPDLQVHSFDDLTGAAIMHAADFEAVFVAATMSPPGIEPPLELR